MFRKKVLIACYSKSSMERLKVILLEYNLRSQIIETFSEIENFDKDVILIAKVIIKNGFECDDLIVITEQDLFGEKILKLSDDNNSSRELEKLIKEQNNLSIGDLVIHKDYGLGRFIGLETIGLDNLKNDYLKIEYANNSHLFIPIEDFDLVSRYGDYRSETILDKLGSEKWAVKRNKVREKLESIAKELIKIASFRKLSKAPILVPNENEYREFCIRFNYTETKDQLKAIQDIEKDLSKGIPADRLICGDVGFGKTEVALRAAFIASESAGNAVQVAVISPTTLLCRQHYNLFKERFRYTGVNVATISRLTSPAENKKTREKLENGGVDIIIGTHALLSDKVKFKNLGLLIVDEEQRFGVKQKEKLKEIGSGIHLISLSATPIPRTLQMAMTGIRDLSLITTPPVDRLNISTYVMDFDEIILREAINRELNRKGKVIIVVPRISDIQQIELKLSNTLRNIKYRIAHGQMSSVNLDRIINDFYDGQFQVLIATTIIESGLDIPDANTIIIYRADRFGLSQLHQLRGRVGRGKVKAYAYLTTNPTDTISINAKKRLKSIEEVQEIGGGFAIASDDMEIRGSGNIIGEEQSGHIKDVGIELYNQMLVEAVNKIKNSDDINLQEYDFSPQVKLNISTTISEDYINDISLRLYYYKKLADVKNDREKQAILLELENRFGKVPEEIFNILEITKIKALCKKIGITNLEISNNYMNIKFLNDKFSKPDYLIKLIQEGKAEMKKQNILSFFIKKISFFDDIEKILNDLLLKK